MKKRHSIGQTDQLWFSCIENLKSDKPFCEPIAVLKQNMLHNCYYWVQRKKTTHGSVASFLFLDDVDGSRFKCVAVIHGCTFPVICTLFYSDLSICDTSVQIEVAQEELHDNVVLTYMAPFDPSQDVLAMADEYRISKFNQDILEHLS